MASKRSGHDAKCSRAVSINSRSKQPLQKKTSLNSKFDAILNWKCIFCDSNCGDEPCDHPFIECFACKKFAHLDCSQLSELESEYISKSENMQWVCDICKEQSKPIYSHIEAKLDLILKMMPKINYFEDRIEHLENALTTSDCKMESKINDLIDKKIEEEISELEEKESRKNNIIMVNLNESDKRVNEDRKKDDLNKVKDVLAKIAPESTELISNPIRLGKFTDNKSRLLKINVGSVENKMHILKNANRLNKGIAIKNKIYINADLTIKERKQQKVLRDELKLRKDAGEIDLRINYRTMRIVKKVIHKQSERKDMSGDTDRASDNSPASL